MDLKGFLKKSKSDDVLMVGGDLSPEQKPKRSLAAIMYTIAWVVFLAAFLFSFQFTGRAIDDYRFQLRNSYQLIEQKKVEQKNLEALQLLSSKVDEIRQDQVLVTQAVPAQQRSDQVISYLEYLVNQVRKEAFMQIPEAIAWSQVSETDISNGDLLDMEVYEYRFSFLGDYEALVSLLENMRTSLRILDVRALRGLKRTQEGLVTADLIFWAYNLYL